MSSFLNRAPSLSHSMPEDRQVRIWPYLALACVWTLILFVVSPAGEFMVNDDWSFMKALETLVLEGKIPLATGWGPPGSPGGPSLLVHILWGGIFAWVWGLSPSVLRISVLVLGALGSGAMIALLRLCGASPGVALLGALTLVVNPLFLSQSYTFMTDVTFASTALFSVYCFCYGALRDRRSVLIPGLVLALAAMLIRQVGIFLPLAYVIACLWHPMGERVGRLRIVVLVLGIVVGPWLVYEAVLSALGSTPITQHQVFHRLLSMPLSKGLLDYTGVLAADFATALAYVGFLGSPLIALRLDELVQSKGYRFFALVWVAAFVAWEALIAAGVVAPPVAFLRNVIYDFGIGPVLLKDVYILGIPRFPALSPTLFYALVCWAGLSAGGLLFLTSTGLKRIVRRQEGAARPSFAGLVALLSGLAYLVLILLPGFHDRYLIPLCMLVSVWLIADMPQQPDFARNKIGTAAMVAPLVLLAAFTIPSLHDFMEMKRALATAHSFILHELHANPCRVDGGFEFNGYHCYRQEYREKPGLSWWWVDAEDYLVTVGPLTGYTVVKEVPFRTLFGRSYAVFVLRPEQGHSNGNPAPHG